MKAIVFDKNHEAHYVDNIKLKEDSASCIVVKVEACGLCGSDVNKIRDNRLNLENKILGHEISGLIYDAKESSFKKNQRVVINPLVPCYSCKSCHDGNHGVCGNLKIIGRDLDGGFAEFVSVPADNVHLISDNLSFEEATFTDLIACGIHIYNLSGSPNNLDVLVIGDGPLGLISSFVFGVYGNRISLEGKHNFNINVAKKHDIKADYFSSKLFEDNGYDIVIECVGRSQSETLEESISKVKKRGKIIVSGVFGPDFYSNICLRPLFYKEAVMQGSNCHGLFSGLSEFREALNFLETRKIDVNHLITHVLKLEDFNKGLNLLSREDSSAIKIIYKNGGINI